MGQAITEQGARVLVLEREKQSRDRVRREAIPSSGTVEAKELGIYDLLQDICGHELPWLDIYVGPARIAHRPGTHFGDRCTSLACVNQRPPLPDTGLPSRGARSTSMRIGYFPAPMLILVFSFFAATSKTDTVSSPALAM